MKRIPSLCIGILLAASVCIWFWCGADGLVKSTEEKAREYSTGTKAAQGTEPSLRPAESPPLEPEVKAQKGQQEEGSRAPGVASAKVTTSAASSDPGAVALNQDATAAQKANTTKQEGATVGPKSEPSAAQILSQNLDMTIPANRAKLVQQLQEAERQKEQRVLEKARKLSLQLRIDKPGGGAAFLVDFDGDRPLYRENQNADAAISTSANLVRSTLPYNVDGTGVQIGLWEEKDPTSAGAVGTIPRLTHHEFGSRISVGDSSTVSSVHATHVAGTLIAAGYDTTNPLVRGMAPGATILAYSADNDISEMTALGAAAAGEPGKIYLSNHSYAFNYGWR